MCDLQAANGRNVNGWHSSGIDLGPQIQASFLMTWEPAESGLRRTPRPMWKGTCEPLRCRSYLETVALVIRDALEAGGRPVVDGVAISSMAEGVWYRRRRLPVAPLSRGSMTDDSARTGGGSTGAALCRHLWVHLDYIFSINKVMWMRAHAPKCPAYHTLVRISDYLNYRSPTTGDFAIHRFATMAFDVRSGIGRIACWICRIVARALPRCWRVVR